MAHSLAAVASAVALVLPADLYAQTRIVLGLNANPLFTHVVAADSSQFSDGFGKRNFMLHYSGGPMLQVSGQQFFVETAFRYDRHSAILQQHLNDRKDVRRARVHYTGVSVPLLFGFRLSDNTAKRYQLFGVAGGWARWHSATHHSYYTLSRRSLGSTVSAISNTPGSIWQLHRVDMPDLNAWQQSYGLEAGFRIRINVKNVGRVEYGLTYEWAANNRDPLVITPSFPDSDEQRLVPKINAVRFNLCWQFVGWVPAQSWKRVSRSGA